jgi:hypothetical protein
MDDARRTPPRPHRALIEPAKSDLAAHT